MADESDVAQVWLIGAGPMADAYLEVLTAQQMPVVLIGRDARRARDLAEKWRCPWRSGGLKQALDESDPPARAIVATGVESLAECAADLMQAGTEAILVEKPAGIDHEEIQELSVLAGSCDCEVTVAYNRRYFASTRALRSALVQDGGATSCTFSFTELSHRIEALEKAPGVKEAWFLANSTHVVDLAFHLIGAPIRLSAEVAGELSWHPAGSVFTGSGRTGPGVLFSYHADWTAPGRWGLEICTRTWRYVMCPMERLRRFAIGEFESKPVEIDDGPDVAYKPGLFRQVEAWLAGDGDLCDIHEHAAACRGVYRAMVSGGVWGQE